MNNEMLAAVWRDDIPQVCVVWPLIWKHYPKGNWFITWDISKPHFENMQEMERRLCDRH